MLQRPLGTLIPISAMEAALESFSEFYTQYYHQEMLHKLGFDRLSFLETEELIDLTLQFLFLTKVNYGQFFRQLREKFSTQWQKHPDGILQDLVHLVSGEEVAILKRWCWFYHQLLVERSPEVMKLISQRLKEANPSIILSESEIESIWQPINKNDDWQLFFQCIKLFQP
jgi:uncharacterized protein YdiU (UPF0061 family)